MIYAYGLPRWKHPVVRQCFPGRKVVFLRHGSHVPSSAACLALWGMAPVPEGVSAGTRILRIEDGFLRSVGLGADLVRPLSWVVDGQGIYYDATQPSDLENLLAHGTFSEALCVRAASLRQRVIAGGLTKYNVGHAAWQRPVTANRVVLVPGQVESDASLAFGAPGVRSNMGLLQAVRRACPDAYVVYKPHPDVLARLRIEGKDEKHAFRWCDEVVTNVSMGDMLAAVDEVHVLTSLAGFEALLRGKHVVCYGQPFYAGWGLTRDLVPHPRRQRQLTLDELVAGVLIAYPLYLSRDGRSLLTAEQALNTLLAWRQRTGGKEPWWRSLYRMVLRRVAGVR